VLTSGQQTSSKQRSGVDGQVDGRAKEDSNGVLKQRRYQYWWFFVSVLRRKVKRKCYTKTLLNVKNAKIPVFDETKENFPVRWLRFQTFAKTYKSRQMLKETPEADLPCKEEEEASDSDEQKVARQRNDDAVYCLTLALEKQATRFIFKGMTSVRPNGKAT
jgi:hypothetical protein